MIFQIATYVLLWCVGGAYVLLSRTQVFGEYFTDRKMTKFEVLINFIFFLWELLRWPYHAWQWNEYYKGLSDEGSDESGDDEDEDEGRQQ